MCPICKERGGDPKKVSIDLCGHLALRHETDPLYCINEDLFNKLLEKLFAIEEKKNKNKK